MIVSEKGQVWDFEFISDLKFPHGPGQDGISKMTKRAAGHTENPDWLEDNRRIAYTGVIGEGREAFCLAFIRQKQVLLKDIKQEVMMQAQLNKDTLACRKGCSSCCSLYVEAGIKECEAVVYYLYQNKSILSLFLHNYADWEKQLKKNGNVFRKCEQSLIAARDGSESEAAGRAVSEALLSYRNQNIPCPFLHNHECMIYEVRPFTCAVYYVSTPPGNCDLEKGQRPEVCKALLPEEMNDLDFYYKELAQPVFATMAVAVYEILREGYAYLSRVTGLEGLEEKAGLD
jgi:Fe-S-cluster containining protein